MQIEAKPGDLFLFTQAHGLNKLITAFSHTPFYHVAFYAGGPFVVGARPRGVVRRDLRGPDGDKVFSIVPAPCSPEQAIEALRWAEGKIGLRYDPLNVGVLVLDRSFPFLKLPSLPTESYSCGEIIVHALRAAGFDPTPGMDAADVLPSDFMRFLPPDAPVCEGAPRGEFAQVKCHVHDEEKRRSKATQGPPGAA